MLLLNFPVMWSALVIVARLPRHDHLHLATLGVGKRPDVLDGAIARNIRDWDVQLANDLVPVDPLFLAEHVHLVDHIRRHVGLAVHRQVQRAPFKTGWQVCA